MNRCILIVPSFQPRKEFPAFIDELLQLNIGPVLVVDDGSGLQYRQVFRAVNAKRNCIVIYHKQNRGKGASIKTAIRFCENHFFDYRGIITVDCDGQHLPKDIYAVYKRLMRTEDDHLVLGIRSLDRDKTPGLNRLGNNVSSRLMKGLYSIDLEDTQTGLRGFPRSQLKWLEKVRGDRYDYELNVLIEAKKNGVSFDLVNIETVYFRGNIDSHYRPVADTLHIGRIIARGVLKYFASSLTATLLDLTLFTLLTKIFFAYLPLSERLLIGTLIARIFASVLNYAINSKLVFSQEHKFYPTMVKFYSVWICQLTVSYCMVLLFTSLTGIDEVFIKMIVDSILALISYQIQLRWVFKDPNHKIRRIKREN